jgi:hypothetical protein
MPRSKSTAAFDAMDDPKDPQRPSPIDQQLHKKDLPNAGRNGLLVSCSVINYAL